MKRLVISGISLFEGGPLSIYYDCIDEILRLGLYKTYQVVAFVHKKELFIKYENKIEIVELPKARENYINRLYYEYVYFKLYSLNQDIDVWLSLHDITPNVKAKKIYTYCHNPMPFIKPDIRKLRYGWRNVAFPYFYKYLYGINIKKATGIIVQQDWIRQEFKRRYFVRNVMVARPHIDTMNTNQNPIKEKQDKKIFIYAAFPRSFKNYEIICKACELYPVDDYEVWFTIDGSENKYAQDLHKKYGNIVNIKWLGLQAREKIFEMYKRADCLIFPSKLETWGLPISEFKLTGKDILLVDLPYAYETLGTYEKVMFFDKDDANRLAGCMKMVVEKTQEYQPQREKVCAEPKADNWEQLFKLLM